MTVLEAVEQKTGTESGPRPFWTRVGLIPLAALMLVIGAVFRYTDTFVLGLGATWLNILPSKIIPLTITVALFWVYRRPEIKTVLGLETSNLRNRLVFGASYGLLLYLMINVISTVIYSFIDTSMGLQFTILIGPSMLVYTFFFFAVNAIYEETLFRGMVQNSFREKYGSRVGIFVSAVIFGFWHITWPIQQALETGIFPVQEAAVTVIFSAILGAVFGIYYEKFAGRKSLLVPIAAHTILNYLNESFKVALDTVIQGPDLSFVNSTHMAIGLVFALGMFVTSIAFFWKFRAEQVKARLGFHTH
jgi:membrane protease YdiL (CAAX protease family)